MTLNGYSEDTFGYNTVVKNGELPDANDVKAIVPPIGGIMDWHKNFGAADNGTTDNTVSDKLEESGQNFQTTVKIGMIVFNSTDNTFAYVTAVDSDTVLSLSEDIMVSGDVYIIYKTPYLADAWLECNGQVVNDADSPYNGETLPDLNGAIQDFGTNTGISDTTLTDSSKSWGTNAYAGMVVEIMSGSGIGQVRTIASNSATALTFSDNGDWSINPSTSIKYQIHNSRKFIRSSYKSGANGLGGGAWHRLTIAELASHVHTVSSKNSGSGWPYDGFGASGNSGATGGDDIFDNRPPYYELVKIIRVK